MSEFNKIVYGEEYAFKIKELEKGLQKIEEEYIDYFTGRPPLFENQPHDLLKNHYFYSFEFSKIIFGFKKESDLDKQIIEKSKLLFKTIFLQSN